MTKSRFELLHPMGVRVSGDLTEAELLAALPEGNSMQQDMHTGWVWYQLPPFPDADVQVGMSLGFNQGVLQQISLTDTHPRHGTNWSEWTEHQERDRATSISAWLGRRGIPPGKHSWGEVSAGVDAKGSFGGAWVRFSN